MAAWLIALALAGQSYSWTEADRQQAVAAAKIKGNAWFLCLSTALHRYQASDEKPDIIATAALGTCEQEEGAYRDAVAASFRGVMEPDQRTVEADRIVARGRAKFRDRAIAAVLDHRLAKARGK